MIGWVLLGAVVVASGRLVWRQRRAPWAGWRLAALLVLQAMTAGLLWCVLEPPRSLRGGATLVVMTARARGGGGGGVRVALAEADAPAAVEAAPDLATALRRHPETRRLLVLGEGLAARDRAAAETLPVVVGQVPPLRGLVRVVPPPQVAPGAGFVVAGAVAGVDGATVELVDPAGVSVDRAVPGAEGDFRVTGAARVAGTALFKLRVRDRRGRVAEQAAVPVWTVTGVPPQLLLIGSPGPEAKYLARWASDAGLDLRADLALGGGLAIGGAVPVSDATLGRADVAIVDERRWAAMGAGGRAALVAAVRAGLGLVLRIDGPVGAETRRQWRALGWRIVGEGSGAPVRLTRYHAVRAGPGTRDAPTNLSAPDRALPVPTRWAVRDGGGDSVPLIRDAGGAALVRWRALGRGRVALWTVADSWLLVLAGEGARHAEWWSDTVAAVARPRVEARATLPAIARAGQRMTMCGIAPGARVAGPGGAVRLLIDPATPGCAGYWPVTAGWHRLLPGGQPFFVQPEGALAGVAAAERREATGALAARPLTAAPGSRADAPGPVWPWFLGWLASAALLWWLERGRRVMDGRL